MIRLRVGYLITGILTGFVLLLSFFATIPDGKLHIVFCDVGQGDGMYIRFPGGKDMVVDGGPNNAIIQCLSDHMPFWDRNIDIVLLTHPDADHLTGLLSVLERYQVQYVVRSDVEQKTEKYTTFKQLITQKKITEKLVTTGEQITFDLATVSVVWPSKEQIALMRPVPRLSLEGGKSVLGASTTGSVNDGSVVFSLSYGMFDALFMGDADSHVQPNMIRFQGGLQDRIGGKDGVIEVVKVPHHGSKTGMTDAFLQTIKNSFKGGGLSKLNVMAGLENSFSDQKPLAVISVGKNSYGHPDPGIVEKLTSADFQVLRTDKAGDIEVVSDGKTWEVKE